MIIVLPKDLRLSGYFKASSWRDLDVASLKLLRATCKGVVCLLGSVTDDVEDGELLLPLVDNLDDRRSEMVWDQL